MVSVPRVPFVCAISEWSDGQKPESSYRHHKLWKSKIDRAAQNYMTSVSGTLVSCIWMLNTRSGEIIKHIDALVTSLSIVLRLERQMIALEHCPAPHKTNCLLVCRSADICLALQPSDTWHPGTNTRAQRRSCRYTRRPPRSDRYMISR